MNEDRAERGLEPVEGGEEPLVDNRRIPLSMAGVVPETPPESQLVESVSVKAMNKIKEIMG